MANTSGKQQKSGSGGSAPAVNIVPSSGRNQFRSESSGKVQRGTQTAGSSTAKTTGNNSSNSFAAYRNGQTETANSGRKTLKDRLDELFGKDDEEKKKESEKPKTENQKPNTRSERARQAREQELGIQKASSQQTEKKAGQTGQEKSRSRTLAQYLMDQAVPEQAGMTGQEANRNRVTNRNYLAETVTQPKTEEKKTASGKTYEQLTQQANQLQREKELVLLSGGTAANTAGYDARIADLLMQAQQLSPEEKKGPSRHSTSSYSTQTKTNSDRDRLLQEYNKAVEEERAIIGYATDPLTEKQANEITARRIDLEEQLRGKNLELGNNEYADLSEEAKGRAGAKSFWKEREGLAGAAIGTGMEWAGSKLDKLPLYLEDPETGELRELQENPLTTGGRSLFNKSTDLLAKSAAQWENATTDLSGLAKTAADISKPLGNAGVDMIENQLLPGFGTMHMILRTAGGGAVTQSQREKNDIDTRMGKAAFDGAMAWLSTKLVGGMESVYGKSVLGEAMNLAYQNLSKPVQAGLQVVLNTEGVEEGLEYILGYLGDKYLGFDQQAEFNRDELWQNAAVGYALGTVFKGLEVGIEYDAKSLRAVADEAAEFADRGLTIEEAERIALSQPNEDVKIVPGRQRTDSDLDAKNVNVQAQTGGPSAHNGSSRTEASPAPQIASLPQQQDVINILLNPKGENGRLSNSQVRTIMENPDLLQAFQEVTGTTPDTSAASRTRNSVKDAAAQFQAEENLRTDARTQADQRAEIDSIIDEVRGWEAEGDQNTDNTQLNIDNAANPEYNGINTKGVMSNDGGRGDQEAGSRISGRAEGMEVPAAGRNESNGNSSVDGGILLSDSAKTRLQERGVTVADAHQTTDSAAFSAALDAARSANTLNGWAVTPKTVEDLSAPGTKAYLSDNGSCGFVVTADGDIEAVFANHDAGAPRGATKSLIPQAIANGGTKLDCFGPVLAKLYQQYGMIPVARVAFDPEIAKESNPGWDESKGMPDIYVMMHNGDSADTVVDNYGNYPVSMIEELESLPLMSYDDAMEYRDWKLERRNTQNAQAAAEPQNAPVTNPAPQGAEIPPTGQESNTGGLTAPETNTEARTAQNSANPEPETANPEGGRQRLSQFFSNTLTESARTEGLDPLTYDPKPEAESLANAVSRMKEDYQGLMDELMRSNAWDGEMVDAAWAIENEIYKEYLKTGDRSAWDAWRKVEDQKIRETARGLQAVAKQSRPGAAGVLNAIMKEIEAVRQSNALAKAEGRTADIVSEEVLSAAEQRANDIAQKMGNLELGIDERVEQGMSREEALESVRKQYLDLVEEIIAARHTGLMLDAGKDAAIRKGVQGVRTLFRKLLSKQDMAYIQRYAACQAAGIAEDLHYEGKQDLLKRLNTWQKLAQLTGTGTWGRNLVGNFTFSLVDLLSADNPVTLIADAVLGKKTGKRSQGFEWGYLSRQGRQQALQNLQRSVLEVAGNIDLAADPDRTKYDMSRTRTFDPDGKMLERTLSRWEQLNGYALQSSDAWFKGLSEGSVRSALIRANGWDAGHLTDAQKAELDEVTRQVAEYRTFQNKGVSAEQADKIRDGLNKLGAKIAGTVGIGNGEWKPGQFGLGTAIMPYTTVPTNIGVKALEFSPAGAVKGLAEMIKVGKDAKAGKATMAQQNQAVTDFGRGVTGTALIVGLAALMKNAPWFRDWEDEEDKNVKAQNKAEGKSGQQINVDLFLRNVLDGEEDATWRNGDQAVDISSIEPLTQLLTVASLLSEDESVINAFYRATKDSFMGLPSVQALQNIENSFKYSDTPDDIAQTWANMLASTAGGIAGGFIPAPLRHASAAADEYQRDTSGNNAAERAWNQIVAATPWRQSLPVKTDAYGNPVTQGDLSTRLKNQYGANKWSEVNQSEVSREVERLREETGIDLTPDRTGPKNQSFGKGEDKQTVKLDAEDSRAWKNAYGKAFEELMTEMMGSETYRGGSADNQTELGGVMKNFAKDSIKKDFAEYYGLPYESQYDEIRKLDRPEQYLAAHELWGNAMKEGDWDTVDMLLQSSMSEKDREYMREHTDKFGTYLDFAQDGVSARKADQYQDELKDLYTSEDRSSANGYDILRTVASGDYTDEEADAIMNRTKSDGSYYAGKGRVAVYNAVRAEGYDRDVALQFWDMLDTNQNGQLTKKELKAAIGAFPEPYRSNIRRSVSSAMGW